MRTVATLLGGLALMLAAALLTNPAAASSHWDMVVLSPEARAIGLKIQCPICEGESIVESQATLAKQMRATVQEKVDAGWTEAQILTYFRDSYGTRVLREPPRSGVSLGVWLVPPTILLAGLALVAAVALRWRRASALAADDVSDEADEDLVERELRRLHEGDGP